MINENEFEMLLDEWSRVDGYSNMTEREKSKCISFLWNEIKQLKEKNGENN